MSIMAKYAQIIWAHPTNEDVLARNQSVELLSSRLAGLSSREAIDTAAAIAGSFAGRQFDVELSSIVEKAISAKSAAFVLKGSEQQGVVCLAVAALALVQKPFSGGTGWTAADAIAASLWSALTLQDQIEHAKVEELRQDLIEACRKRVRHIGKGARQRQDVPDVGNLSIPESEPTGTRANTAYRRATAPVIKALKENQDLDREEIDFLWWVIADYSELLDCPLDDRRPLCRAVAVGLEGATMLRRLPSDGFRHAVLRLVEASESLSLAELVASLSDDRAELGKSHVGTWAATMPVVFPLIAALATTGDVHGPAVKLDARGWGARALLEASIVAMEGRLGMAM